MLTALILTTVLQTTPLPLPRIQKPPEGLTGGANIDLLASKLSGVVTGALPADAPLLETSPLLRWDVATGRLVEAQTLPANPSEVAFGSPDHAIITDYEIGFFLVGATQPVQVNKQAKPALSGDGDVHLTFTSRPLGLGVYELKVRPYANAEVGAWSAAVPFERALSGIGPIRIVR